MIDGNQGMGYWVVLGHSALNQNQNGGFSATPTQTDSFNAGDHPASVAEMSVRDQFFVALGKNRPDGLPIITAGNN